MEKQEFNALLLDYVAGKLDKTSQIACKQYIKNHPEVQNEVQELSSIWAKMDEVNIPEPSATMDDNFYTYMFEVERAKALPKQTAWDKLNAFLDQFYIKQMAMAVALVCIGVFVGTKFTAETAAPNNLASDETNQVRSQLVLELINESSPGKRMQALSEADKLQVAETMVIDALLRTLNNDPNTNVRLATLESLSKYADNPKVRKGLVASITKQESPLLQIALADLMVTLQEKGSIDSMKELLKQPEMDQTVRDRIQESISSI